MHVVVVESPAKVKTLRGALDVGYEVVAPRGHVKDLPAKDGSVDPARDFAMHGATRRGAARALGAIAAALRRHAGTGRLRSKPQSLVRLRSSMVSMFEYARGGPVHSTHGLRANRHFHGPRKGAQYGFPIASIGNSNWRARGHGPT